MKGRVVALFSGLLFSVGLCLSGMTRPSKVVGFLDFTGAWDPSLAFVMVGAISVTALALRFGSRRSAPVSDEQCASEPPAGARVDTKLIGGAAIFGLGWGLSGLCPGPAIVSIASGRIGAVVFVVSMVLGMFAHRAVARLRPFGETARSLRGAPSRQ